MSRDGKKWALITGCSNATGLGIELAKLLIGRGYGVFATARSEGKLAAAKAEGCIPLELDVTKPESIRAAADRVHKKTGGVLHCLVNNAGFFGRGLVLDSDINKYKYAFDVNIFEPLMMAQAFAPLMVRAGLTGRTKPCIMNVGSICEVGSPHVSAYSTSKAALRALSNALRVETAGLGLNVIHVVIGAVSSGGHDEFSLGEGATNMRRDAPDAEQWTAMSNPVSPTETVYRDCRDEAWNAELAVTKEYHEASTDTPQSVAKSLLEAIEAGGPAYIHLAYQGWQTKYILPWLPTSILDKSVKKMCGLDKIHPNSDAGEA